MMTEIFSRELASKRRAFLKSLERINARRVIRARAELIDYRGDERLKGAFV